MHAVARGLHYVAGVVMVALMLMIVANIVGRWAGVGGVAGAVELTQVGMVALVFFGLAYAQSRGDHITVDLLYLRLPRAGKVVMDAVSALLTVAVLAVLTWQLLEYRGILEAAGRETNTLGLPLHPVTWFAIVGTAGYALAVVATAVVAARGGSPGSDDGRVVER